jgi:hypothetical protein
MRPKLWLDTKSWGEQAGKLLAKWLNEPDLNPRRVEELLTNAQLVYRWIAKYPTQHRLNVARRQKKLPPEFWNALQKLNKTLVTLAYAAQIDLNWLDDGNPLSLMLISTDKQIAIPTREATWLLQLMEQRTILNIRRCKHCRSWLFARVAQQIFCNKACRVKHLTASEKFKKKRRKYMRRYYILQNTKNVK